MIQNTRERVLRKVPNGCLKISFNTSCTGKWPLKFPFNSIFDDLGRHSFANSLAHVAICFACVRRFVSKLSPYLQSSFDLEEKHKISRSKGARKELQPEKEGKSIRCHFQRAERATSENVASYL